MIVLFIENGKIYSSGGVLLVDSDFASEEAMKGRICNRLARLLRSNGIRPALGEEILFRVQVNTKWKTQNEKMDGYL